MGHSQKEYERNDPVLQKLQRTRDKWNEDIMKQLDFIDRRLHQKNTARVFINNFDEAILVYYRLFAKRIKPLRTES